MNHQELGADAARVTFDEDLQATVPALRSALLELLISVDADPTKPQDLARRFGLNKNLTWKISKTLTGLDYLTAVPHIPGSAGLKIFLGAVAGAGAPEELVDEATRAALEFDRAVKVHTGDRNTLDIMINDRLPVTAQAEHSESNRKRAYQANSGIWGVRARTQLTLSILAPNADEPDMADLVQVMGLDRFRRLRPNARWLLFRRERWSDDDPRPAPDELESLDPRYPVDRGVPFLGDFCSKPIPEIEHTADEGEDQYELPPGPIGNTAAFTCIHGQMARRVGPAYAEKRGEHTELGCNLITPAENLVFDMLVHRDFGWAMRPQLVFYSRMDGGGMQATARRDRNRLPPMAPLHDLGWGVAGLTTSLLPRYSKLVRYVFERLRWDPDDFRAHRLALSYPPIPTVALLRSELPVREAK